MHPLHLLTVAVLLLACLAGNVTAASPTPTPTPASAANANSTTIASNSSSTTNSTRTPTTVLLPSAVPLFKLKTEAFSIVMPATPVVVSDVTTGLASAGAVALVVLVVGLFALVPSSNLKNAAKLVPYTRV